MNRGAFAMLKAHDLTAAASTGHTLDYGPEPDPAHRSEPT
jgi:hypothetical protein